MPTSYSAGTNSLHAYRFPDTMRESHSEQASRQQAEVTRIMEEYSSVAEAMREVINTPDEEAVAPTNQQTIVNAWFTTIDPTFNNKMDEMLLASHVDVKDLWRKN